MASRTDFNIRNHFNHVLFKQKGHAKIICYCDFCKENGKLNDNIKFIEKEHWYVQKTREWENNIPMPEYENYEQNLLYVIGDIHADLATLLVILYSAGLIGLDGWWRDDNMKEDEEVEIPHICLCGDLVDGGGRGSGYEQRYNDREEIDIFQYIENMNKNGKRIWTVVGNHEFTAALHDKRYVSYRNNHTEWSNDESFMRKYLASVSPACIRIGNCYISHSAIDTHRLRSLSIPDDMTGMQVLNRDAYNTLWYNKKMTSLLHHLVWDRGIAVGKSCNMNKYAKFLSNSMSGNEETLDHVNVSVHFVGHSSYKCVDKEDCQRVCKKNDCRDVAVKHCKGRAIVLDTNMSPAFGAPLKISYAIVKEAQGIPKVQLINEKISTIKVNTWNNVLV